MNKKKGSPIGCLFWIALILLVVVVFLFNRNKIIEVLKNTNFVETIVKEKEKKNNKEKTPDEKQDTRGTPAAEDDKEPRSTKTPGNGTSEPGSVTVAPQPEREKPSENIGTEPSSLPTNVRNARLYFIDVNNEGEINLKGVIRPVNYVDSPLTDTLKALVGGLLPSELNMELMTLIPEHSELKAVRVSEGTAYLDFNEAFRFNSLGKEGHTAQLKQIVYTATEFPTVKNVQILIEGKQEDYMGPEGVYIGKPLTRESF